MSLFVSPKFFGLYVGCSLKTVVTFLENVAINKKTPLKLYFCGVLRNATIVLGYSNVFLKTSLKDHSLVAFFKNVTIYYL